MSKKDEVIHNPPPKGEAPADSVTPKPDVAKTMHLSRQEAQGWPTPRPEDEQALTVTDAADIRAILAEARMYVEKSMTEPKPGAKRRLVGLIDAAIRTAETHDLIERTKYLDMVGTVKEAKLIPVFFEWNPDVRERWIKFHSEYSKFGSDEFHMDLNNMTGRCRCGDVVIK